MITTYRWLDGYQIIGFETNLSYGIGYQEPGIIRGSVSISGLGSSTSITSLGDDPSIQGTFDNTGSLL